MNEQNSPLLEGCPQLQDSPTNNYKVYGSGQGPNPYTYGHIHIHIHTTFQKNSQT